MIAIGTADASATTVPLPTTDLGNTNIFDGEGPPGVLLEIISGGSVANRLELGSNVAPGRNRQRTAAFTLHPIAEAETRWLGAHPGIDVFIPFAHVENRFDAGGSGTRTGLGDVTVEPFLQWTPERPHAGSVSVRLGLQVDTPTGNYRAQAPLSIGHGGWQISPYVAATWRVGERLEISERAIYDWSGAIRAAAPDTAAPDTALVSARAGDFAVLNLSSSYAVATRWRLGIGGYMLEQLSLSRIDGLAMAGGREQVFALGPLAQVQMGKNAVRAAIYREFAAANRPEGLTFNLRLECPL